MIYLTGDTHGSFERFSEQNFPEQLEMTKDDYVIICGDFGGVWTSRYPYSLAGYGYVKEVEEEITLNDLNELPFTLLFVDGNHENYDRLDAYPVEDWNGGKVHKIMPSVIHLMRGQVYTIGGKKIFTFGGASSHDISDGIIPFSDYKTIKKTADKMREEGRDMFRINHLSWWERELPDEEEMNEGEINLEAHGNKVDYIITHSPSASVTALLGHGSYRQDRLTRYLEEIKQTVEYKEWFCGHMHVNRNVSTKDIVIYEQIIRIA